MQLEKHTSVHPRYEARLPLSLRLLAGLMRSLPTDVRRVDMLWRSLYRKIGARGGTDNGFAPDAAIDSQWPTGLQTPIRGRQHGLLMRLDLQNWSDRRTYFSGRYYQQDISRILLGLLRPDDQYIDIGANIGMTALLASSRIGPKGKGVAFEPNPAAFTRLKEHLDLNAAGNFQLYPFAVADHDSTQQLYVPGDQSQLGSLAPGRETGAKSFEVQTVTADRYLSAFDSTQPTIIKIDVEGFEVQVLEGLRSVLDWPEVVVVTEIGEPMLRRAGHSRDELHAVLGQHGLLPHSIHVRATRWRKDLELDSLTAPLDVDQYDALFVRPNSEIYRRRIEPLLASHATSA